MSRYLLDTHAFLWWITDSPSLSERARATIGAGDNEIFLSAASAWEIAIKTKLGRLQAIGDPESSVPFYAEQSGFVVLPIDLATALKTYALPDHHADPFDRLLISHALVEELVLISSDKAFERYPIEVYW